MEVNRPTRGAREGVPSQSAVNTCPGWTSGGGWYAVGDRDYSKLAREVIVFFSAGAVRRAVVGRGGNAFSSDVWCLI